LLLLLVLLLWACCHRGCCALGKLRAPDAQRRAASGRTQLQQQRDQDAARQQLLHVRHQ
jgi:hypothetical protein